MHETIAAWRDPAPGRTALICERWPVGYAELHRESNRVAHSLCAAKAGPGVRVAYLGAETEHFYEVLLACAAIGAVLVPLDRRLPSGEIVRALTDADVRLVFADVEFAGVAGMPARVGEVVSLARMNLWKSERDGDLDVPRGHADDAVVLLPGSGGVLSHRNLLAAPAELAWQPGDISLVGVPAFEAAGVWWAVQGLAAGITNVTMRSFAAPEASRLLTRHAISIACLAPELMAGLPTVELASLRAVVRAQPLPAPDGRGG